MQKSEKWFYPLRAWTVHLYTSLGIATGFLSLLSIISGDARTFFILQFVSMFIDSTDGYFARRWNVKKWASGIDGRKLDDIIDYLNYAFLPIGFAFRFGLLTNAWAAVPIIVLIAAAYGFCQSGAKTTDGYFTGFPNFWNLLVFYLYLFNFPVPVNAIILLIFAAFIFVPLKFLSFSSRVFKKSSYLLNFIYLVILLVIVVNLYNLDIRLVWFSLIGPMYYFVTALYLHFSGQTNRKI